MNWWTSLVELFPFFRHPHAPDPAPVHPTPGPIARPTVDLFDAANAARKSLSLPPFLADPKADMIAMLRAEKMAASGVLGHAGFEQEVMDRFAGQSVAENVAYDPRGAHAVVLDWLGSPPHLENLTGDFGYAGCGHANHYWCLILRGG